MNRFVYYFGYCLLAFIWVTGLQGQCPSVEVILVDACGTEQDNEYVIINSGAGFLVGDIRVDFAMGNNAAIAATNANNDINDNIDNNPANPTPCGLQTGDISVYTGCTNVVAVGPGFTVPSNALVILQVSSNPTTSIDISNLCPLGQTIYVVQSNCQRGIGAFTNGGSGTRTTNFGFGGVCNESITYDRSQIVGSAGGYYAPNLVPPYGVDPSCSPPDVSISSTCPSINLISDLSGCGSVTLPPITGSNLTGGQAYYTMPGGMGMSLSPGSTITTAGTFTVYAYDGSPGCEDEESFTVTVNPVPIMMNPGNQSGCSGGQIDVLFNGTAGTDFNWTNDLPSIGLPASGMGDISFTAATTGGPVQATITVTPSLNGCDGAPISFVIRIDPVPLVDQLPDLVVCAGDPVSVSFNSNIFGASFMGTNSNTAIGAPASGTTILNFTAANVSSTQVGTISIIATANGCPGPPMTFTITVEPRPNISLINNVLSCGSYTLPSISGINLSGSEAYYSAPNGGGIVFFPGDVISSSTTLYAYDGVPGCEDEVSFIITIGVAGPTVTADITDASCQGQASGAIDLTILGTEPFSVQWSDNPFINDEDRTGLASGNYGVTVLDGAGCETNVTYFVDEPNAISLVSCTAIQNASGVGVADGIGSVRVTGGLAPYIITYQDGAGSSGTASGMGPDVLLENLLPGTYTITSIRDANNCVWAANCTFVIDADSPLCFSLVDVELGSPLCEGGNTGSITLTLGAVVGPLDIQWSDASFGNTLNVVNAMAGTYTVTITDLGNPSCPILTPTAIVLSDISPIVVNCSLVQDATGVANSDGQATIDVGGGNGPYDVLISGNSPSALTGVSGLQTISGLLPGDYTVTIEDANGCPASCMFTVGIQAGGCNLMVRDSVVGITCAGANDGQFIVIISDTIGPVTIEWSIPGFDNQSVALVGAGTYGVTVTDLGANTVCWRALDGATFTEPSDTLTLLCGELNPASGAGMADGIATFVMDGGRGDYTLTLSGPTDSVMSGLNGLFLDVSQLLPGMYQAILRDAFGCEASCDFVISAQGCALTITSTLSPITCAGAADGSISLMVSGNNNPLNFDWGNPLYDGNTTLMGLDTGTYSVTILDGAACSEIRTFTITQPDSLELSCQAVNTASAPLATDGSGSVNIVGGTAPYELILRLGGNADTSQIATTGSVILSNLAVGVYEVVVTDANGCREICQFSIASAGCPLQAQVTILPISCNGAADASIRLDISGNNGAVFVDWNFDAFDGQQDILGIVGPGTYTAVLTDAAGCTFPIGPITITEPASLALSCSVLSDVTQPNASNGSAQAVIVGGTAPYQLINQRFVTPTVAVNDTIVVNNDTIVVSGLDGRSGAVRDYNFILVDANGCRDTCSFQIFEPACPNIFLTPTITAVACFGDSTGRIEVNVNNGTAPYSYEWSPLQPDTNVLEGIPAGVYVLVVQDSNQCTTAQSFEILQASSAPVLGCAAVADASLPGVADGQASLNVSGGQAPYTVQIFGPIDSSFIVTVAGTVSLDGLLGGGYLIQVTDADGCATEECSFTINQGACSLSLNATTIPADCRGLGQIDLQLSNASSPITYNWSVDSLNGQEDPQVAAGIYAVTVTDANGCSDSLNNILVEQIDNEPSLSISDGGAVCFGEPISLSLSFTGPAPFTADIRTNPGGLVQYTGLGNDTTLFFGSDTILGGLLQIELIAFADSLTCGAVISDRRDIVIHYPDTLVRTDRLCSTDTLRIAGRLFSAAFPADTFFVPSATCGEWYEVALDFSAMASVDTTALSLCQGDSITLFGETFSATNPEGLVNTGLLNNSGCDSSLYIRLDFFPLVVDTSRLTLCAGDSLTINGTTLTPMNPEGLIQTGLTNTNGCDSLVYVILDFYPVSVGLQNLTACRGEEVMVQSQLFTFENPSGIIVLEGAAAQGCDSLLAVTVNFLTSPEVSLRGDNSICLGDTTELSFELSGTGTVDLVLQGNDGTAFTLTGISNADRFPIMPQNNVTYTIAAATSGSPCPVRSMGDAVVNVSRLTGELVADRNNDIYQISCNGAADGGLRLNILEGQAPYTILWNNGTAVDRIGGLPPGNYSVSLTDAANCSLNLAATIQEPPPILLSTSVTAPGCNDLSGQLRFDSIRGGTPPYEWSTDGTFFQPISSFPFSQALAPGSYRLHIQDVLDCRTEISLLVPEGQDPRIIMPEDATIRLGDSVFLLVQTDFRPDSILWQPSSSVASPAALGTFVRPLESTQYTVVLQDSSGCRVSGEVLITVDRRVPIYAPNIFSPNADGANDLFRLFAGPGVERIELLQIFDRWGEQVYEASDYDPNNPVIGWNGVHRGQALNPAVFIYYFRARLSDGRVVTQKGDVVLRR